MAALNATVLMWGIYRSPVLRGRNNRFLAWIVTAGWPVNLALILALYGIPYY